MVGTFPGGSHCQTLDLPLVSCMPGPGKGGGPGIWISEARSNVDSVHVWLVGVGVIQRQGNTGSKDHSRPKLDHQKTPTSHA